MAKSQEAKVKINEIALELGLKPKDIMQKAAEIGIEIKSTNSSVLESQAGDIYTYISTGIAPKKPEPKTAAPKKSESSTKSKSKTKKEPKAESKKSESKKTESKKTTPKEEIKEEKKEEPQKPEPRKIIIVSKNKSSEKIDDTKITAAKEAKDKILHPEPQSSPPPPKKPKPPKRPAVSHAENKQKIDINRNLGDTNLDDENEVMMFDINEIMAKKRKRRKKSLIE